MAAVDGIYSGYFSGEGGNGLALFVFQNGVLTGADAAGILFDGSYAEPETGGGLVGSVTVKVPANAVLVQGATAGPSGMVYTVELAMPADFVEQPYLLVTTPLGPVNVKLVKLRGL